MLYEDPSLNGGVYFPEADVFSEVTLTRTGLLNFLPRNKAPYSQVVFFLYNEKTGELELVQDLKDILSIPYQDPQYDPDLRILPKAAEIGNIDFWWANLPTKLFPLSGHIDFHGRGGSSFQARRLASQCECLARPPARKGRPAPTPVM